MQKSTLQSRITKINKVTRWINHLQMLFLKQEPKTRERRASLRLEAWPRKETSTVPARQRQLRFLLRHQNQATKTTFSPWSQQQQLTKRREEEELCKVGDGVEWIRWQKGGCCWWCCSSNQRAEKRGAGDWSRWREGNWWSMAAMEVPRTKESGDGRGSSERRREAHTEKSNVSHRQEKIFVFWRRRWEDGNSQRWRAKIASQMANNSQINNQNFLL